MTSELSAESTEAVDVDTVQLLANIRRSLSERANRRLEGQELPDSVRHWLAVCYNYVLFVETRVREHYELPDAGMAPRWVREQIDL